MSKRLVSALLAASLAVGSAAARPPDLPVDTKDVCIPGVEQEEQSELNTRKVCHPPPVAEPNNAQKPKARPTCPACVDPRVFEKARRLYLIGERCRKAGDLDMAQNCYEESWRLCPVGDYATRATAHLKRMRAARAEETQPDVGEEQEPPTRSAVPDDPCPAEKQAAGASAASAGLIHETDDDVRKLGETRKMYFFGEHCRRGGDLDMAYRCYEEASQICPSCSYAQKALARMRQIKAGKTIKEQGAGEEQESTEKQVEREWRRFWMHDSPRRLPGGAESTVDALRRLAAARRLFMAAESQRAAGRLDRAYELYQRTHLVHPECRFGRKAIERITEIEQERYLGTVPQTEQDELDPEKEVSEDAASPAGCLHPTFPAIEAETVRALDRLLPETAKAPAAIRVIVEEERTEAGEEESEYPILPCGGLLPPVGPVSLFINPPPRDLVVREEPADGGSRAEAPACHDLSDWFVKAVRTLRGAGSLRIEAGRLGHLLARGDGAVRELGCAVVHEGGRCYVVYPAR